MAHMPKPHRQVEWARRSDAALEPANAEIKAGDEVKANASPRFRRFVTSAARTFQVYESPPNPTL